LKWAWCWNKWQLVHFFMVIFLMNAEDTPRLRVRSPNFANLAWPNFLWAKNLVNFNWWPNNFIWCPNILLRWLLQIKLFGHTKFGLVTLHHSNMNFRPKHTFIKNTKCFSDLGKLNLLMVDQFYARANLHNCPSFLWKQCLIKKVKIN